MRFLLAVSLWVMPVMTMAASVDEDSLREESFGYWSSLTKSGGSVKLVEISEDQRHRWTSINAPGYEAEIGKSDVVDGQILRLIRRYGSCEAKDLYIASLQAENGTEIFRVEYTYPVAKLGVIARWEEGFLYHVKDRSLRIRAMYISAKGDERRVCNITEQQAYRSTFYPSSSLQRW